MKGKVVSAPRIVGAVGGRTAILAPSGNIENVGLRAVGGVELDIPVGQGIIAVAPLIQHRLIMGSIGIGQIKADGVVANTYSRQVWGGSTLASIPVRPNPIDAGASLGATQTIPACLGSCPIASSRSYHLTTAGSATITGCSCFYGRRINYRATG